MQRLTYTTAQLKAMEKARQEMARRRAAMLQHVPEGCVLAVDRACDNRCAGCGWHEAEIARRALVPVVQLDGGLRGKRLHRAQPAG